jgi:hypothetical protein
VVSYLLAFPPISYKLNYRVEILGTNNNDIEEFYLLEFNIT